MSYVDDSAAERRAQEANHYYPTPWLRKWALVETGTFIQSPLRGDTVLCLPAEWPTAAASCNHVSVTMDDLSGGVLHSRIAVKKKEDRLRFILKTYGSRLPSALMSFKNISETTAHYPPDWSTEQCQHQLMQLLRTRARFKRHVPKITSTKWLSYKHQGKVYQMKIKSLRSVTTGAWWH